MADSTIPKKIEFITDEKALGPTIAGTSQSGSQRDGVDRDGDGVINDGTEDEKPVKKKKRDERPAPASPKQQNRAERPVPSEPRKQNRAERPIPGDGAGPPKPENRERIPPGGNAGPPKPKNQPKGQVVKGNINLNNRPIVKNSDGSISTVRSISMTEGKETVLIPTVIRNPDGTGKIVSNQEAWRHYKRTGEHLGKFSSPEDADAYAVNLSKEQAAQYLPKKSQGRDTPIRPIPNAPLQGRDTPIRPIPNAPLDRNRDEAIMPYSKGKSGYAEEENMMNMNNEHMHSSIPNNLRIVKDEDAELEPRQRIMYEFYELIAKKMGKWSQDTGPDGAHYAEENPFGKDGMKCINCSFFQGGNRCEVVTGEIDPEAICKLWIIRKDLLKEG